VALVRQQFSRGNSGVKIKTLFTITVVLVAQMFAQSFNRFQDVSSLCDKDFRVQWSDSDPFEVHDGPNYAPRVHIAYLTTVRGKGILSRLEFHDVAMPAACQSRFCAQLSFITVVGVNDHHAWSLQMNTTATFTRGVQFWKLGDVIYLDADKTVRDDKKIPTILDDPATTENVTASCNSGGCYVVTDHGSKLRDFQDVPACGSKLDCVGSDRDFQVESSDIRHLTKVRGKGKLTSVQLIPGAGWHANFARPWVPAASITVQGGQDHHEWTFFVPSQENVLAWKIGDVIDVGGDLSTDVAATMNNLVGQGFVDPEGSANRFLRGPNVLVGHGIDLTESCSEKANAACPKTNTRGNEACLSKMMGQIQECKDSQSTSRVTPTPGPHSVKTKGGSQ
jgi:hypothetical protein